MIQNIFAALALAALMTSGANAQHLPKDKLPAYVLGEWCYESEAHNYRRARCRDSDGWLNVRPKSFSGHEMDCKISISETEPER